MKGYEKLLEKATLAYRKCASNAEKRRLESIFPELKEKGYAKIMKEIIAYLDVQNAISGGEDQDFKCWISWLEKQIEQADYNPYKATIESIAAMVERYADNGDLKDFYDNIKVKCKDAMEYDKSLFGKQGKEDGKVIVPTVTFDDILALECCMKMAEKDEKLYKQLQSFYDRVHNFYIPMYCLEGDFERFFNYCKDAKTKELCERLEKLEKQTKAISEKIYNVSVKKYEQGE